MCACKDQVALRGISGFLDLVQIWIILRSGEKEIIFLDVMAAIPKTKYWFKENDIFFEPWHRTLTEPMLLFSRFQKELMITGSN